MLILLRLQNNVNRSPLSFVMLADPWGLIVDSIPWRDLSICALKSPIKSLILCRGISSLTFCKILKKLCFLLSSASMTAACAWIMVTLACLFWKLAVIICSLNVFQSIRAFVTVKLNRLMHNVPKWSDTL